MLRTVCYAVSIVVSLTILLWLVFDLLRFKHAPLCDKCKYLLSKGQKFNLRNCGGYWRYYCKNPEKSLPFGFDRAPKYCKFFVDRDEEQGGGENG